MNCSRRNFLGIAAAGAAVGCVSGKADNLSGCPFDENLSIIISDAHVCGEKARAAEFTPKRLAAFVDEVLTMRPHLLIGILWI